VFSIICLKSSTIQEAVPIKAPSTPSRAQISLTLATFTEPPYNNGFSILDLIAECTAVISSLVAVTPVPIAHTGS